jgi:hypothetical protein
MEKFGIFHGHLIFFVNKILCIYNEHLVCTFLVFWCFFLFSYLYCTKDNLATPISDEERIESRPSVRLDLGDLIRPDMIQLFAVHIESVSHVCTHSDETALSRGRFLKKPEKAFALWLSVARGQFLTTWFAPRGEICP